MTRQPIDQLYSLIDDQLFILELVFEDPRLKALRKASPRHPAVERYDLLTQLRSERSYDWSKAEMTAQSLSSMLIDQSTWATASSTDFFISIGDDEARLQLRQRLRSQVAFGDAVAELFTHGWLRSEGFAVDLFGAEGLPDLRITRSDSVVWADVKHLRPGSSLGRVRDHIKKANKQIRRVDPDGSGIVFLKLGRPTGATGTSGKPPPDIQPLLDQAIRQLHSGHTRSVALVVAFWDDWLTFPGPRQVTNALRRQSKILLHPEPRRVPTLRPSDVDIAFTAVVLQRPITHR